MKVTITLPDTVYEAIEARVGVENVGKELAKTIERFGHVPAGERALVIWGADRLKLEGVFQTTIDDAAKLYNMLRNTASLKIGIIERPFSPSEIIRLQDQARFHGWSEQKFLELTSNEALDYVMNRM